MKTKIFKEGDLVLVTKKAANFELGWYNTWIEGKMDKSIGKKFYVLEDNGRQGVKLADNGYCFDYPRHVLKKIIKKGDKKNVNKR